MKCADCGKELEQIETGLSRKLINRGTSLFYCLDCLSRKFNVKRDELLAMAERFREAGCAFFE